MNFLFIAALILGSCSGAFGDEIDTSSASAIPVTEYKCPRDIWTCLKYDSYGRCIQWEHRVEYYPCNLR